MATLGQLVATSKQQTANPPSLVRPATQPVLRPAGRNPQPARQDINPAGLPAPTNTTAATPPAKVPNKTDPAKTSNFRWVAETLASAEHPHQNEDAWLIVEEIAAAGLFDGVHSVTQPAKSSREAARAIETALHKLPPTSAALLPQALKTILEELNASYRATNQTAGKPQLAATAAIGLVREIENRPHLIYGLVGDTRITVWHAKTKRLELTVLDDGLLRMLLEQPTKRPAWVRELLAKHGLDPKLKLTFEEAATVATLLDQHHEPGSVSQLLKILFAERDLVTQSLGAGSVLPHVGLIPLDHDDRVVFTTDGIHDNLVESELTQIVATTTFKETAAALIVRAHEVATSTAPRAKMDDMTALVIEIE